jgi:PAS domain S-box-containing protein
MYRILYVDDEPELLDIARLFLEEGGEFEVQTMVSATEAMRSSATLSCDAIIADYQMPEMDGIEFLKAVRKKSSDIPFILFTGRGREEVVIDAINGGADSYLQKGGDPVAQFAELRHRITIAIERRQAIRALRESEDRYRAVVETQTELISRFLPDGTHTFVNEAYCRYFGRTASGILGTKFHPAVSEDVDKAIRQHLDSLSPEHPAGMLEHAILMPEGRIRWQQWSDRAIFDNDGNVREYQSVGRDITEYRQKDEELKKSQFLLNEAMDLARMAYWEIDARTGMFMFNDRFYTLLGTTAGREGGYEMPAEAYVRDFIHPDDRDAFYSLQKLLRQESAPADSIQREHRVLRRDGAIRFVSVRIRILKDAEGRPEKGHGSLQDITEQRTSEEALRESEKLYRTIFETTGTAMTLLEDDATISLVNSTFEQLCGLLRSEIEGKRKWTEFVVKEDLDRMLEMHRLRLQDEAAVPRQYEFRFRRPDDEIRNILLTINMIPGSKRYVASLMDITGLKKMEAELKRSLKDGPG